MACSVSKDLPAKQHAQGGSHSMRGGSHLGHPAQPGPGWGILCDLRVGPLSESPYASREDSGQMLGLWLMAADGLYLEMFKATVFRRSSSSGVLGLHTGYWLDTGT